MQMFRQCCVQHVNGWTIVRQCIVKRSYIWTVMCPTVQCLVYAVFNFPRACELSVQQSNGQTVLFQLSSGRTVLFPIFKRLDNALLNCITDGQCCVQQSMMSQTVQWLSSWVFNCQMVGLSFVKTVQWLDSVVPNSLIVTQCCLNSPMIEQHGVLLSSCSMVGQCYVQQSINIFTI